VKYVQQLRTVLINHFAVESMEQNPAIKNTSENKKLKFNEQCFLPLLYPFLIFNYFTPFSLETVN